MSTVVIRYLFRYRCPVKGRIVTSRIKATRESIMIDYPDAEILEDSAELVKADETFSSADRALGRDALIHQSSTRD